MKKCLGVGLVLCLLLCFVGCGGANAETPAWKTMLQEYESFVDEYIEITNKYKANPTDTTILADYTALAQEMTEWSEKINEAQEELADDPDALKEYMDTLARIAEKLEDVK